MRGLFPPATILILYLLLAGTGAASDGALCYEGGTEKMDFRWEYDQARERRALLLRPKKLGGAYSLLHSFFLRASRDGEVLSLARGGRVFERLRFQGDAPVLLSIEGKADFTNVSATVCADPPAVPPVPAGYPGLHGVWLAFDSGEPLLEMDAKAMTVRALLPSLAARLGSRALPLAAVGEFRLPDGAYMFTMRAVTGGKLAEIRLTMLPPLPEVVCMLSLGLGGDRLLGERLRQAGSYELNIPPDKLLRPAR